MKVLCALIACLPLAAAAGLELSPILADRMVLQAGTKAPIWGKADPGAKVTVSFRGKTAAAKADTAGAWRVELGPFERDTLETAGTELVITTSGETKNISDVLVGEVWLGAGQSNMHTPLNEYWGDLETKDLKEGRFPALRLRKMDQLHEGENWGWWTATDWRNGTFSAQLFGFGIRLQHHFNCPVGLIEAGSNGSPSGPFLSKEGFLASATIAQMTKENPSLAAYADKVGWHWRRMIDPVVPFAVKGIYWDQGEGGTEMMEISQPVVMEAIVASWRKAWGRKLPWIYVQKPSGGGCTLKDGAKDLPADVPGDDWSAGLRQEGIRIGRLPGVSLLVTSDLSYGVHPPIKSSYAERGYRIALANAYGEKVEWTGPTFAGLKRKGKAVEVSFTHVGTGLVTSAGRGVQGFAVAGADGKWSWCDARIAGDKVILTPPADVAVTRVKYATAWPLEWATLFNREGFPALAFNEELK